MLGKMMHKQLTIGSLIEHAGRFHSSTTVTSVETSGETEHVTWGDIDANARKLAAALGRLGIVQSARCGTIAWNNRRHLEIYFGVSGGGYVCHTINPRLKPEQLIYIINHAEDQVLFIDTTFVPAVAQLRAQFTTVQHIVVMGSKDADIAAQIEGVLFYDDLLDAETADYDWPDLDENLPSSLCYTSGTTGNPKGVEYTHRTSVLHTIGGNQPDGLALRARDTVLAVVPMFHVNAWGTPYMTAAVGAKLVLPGPHLDGASLAKLIDAEKVTVALGVPTIWMGLLQGLEETGCTAESLERTIVGGSALPTVMIPTFRDKYGVDLVHAWGMTETSPIGTLNQLLQKHNELDAEAQAKLREGQGRPMYGIDLRIVDDGGAILPHDGETQGNLQICGHWVIDSYFRAGETALTEDGWFDTGDVATIDGDGYMIIRDRSKDIIKSGGEWISTVELEDIAMSHPDVAQAAAIAAKHPKWDERPVVIAVKRSADVTEADLLAHYQGKVASWQIPDRVVFVESLPLGGTGKVQKNTLRERYEGILLDS
ncbi:medium-chain-fatty-acid--CoA ligase AlkK [Phaeobacter piscinae]|uniref:Medium-chain-fatty-acid--CoA ligase AlkK n=1 Tax=Phaeobacter piscinae TaxID=1580596 RepID=A0ABN5DSK2_9RHOB|nr:long-chain-fatty-acid--CoA ligase [Phaeobacter piscinae]ATG37464.1 medium-chain-fatty-acid--CoA ligase AlkK [Phaeobacter piscinae]AUQ87985.1 medium-chain-fatty-acid--CoA ligase AlkK [Phaeobacter piscinae]AUR25868.1 medium-chain-fatty-acid--CoA ligase AlkK [Phaeobacter piscinae]